VGVGSGGGVGGVWMGGPDNCDTFACGDLGWVVHGGAIAGDLVEDGEGGPEEGGVYAVDAEYAPGFWAWL